MSATKRSGSGYSFRDSGSGQYITQRQAERKPANTVERERRTPPPSKRK